MGQDGCFDSEVNHINLSDHFLVKQLRANDYDIRRRQNMFTNEV